MTSELDAVYSRFFDELEDDDTFFDYYNHTDEESLSIAKERARSYLDEACSYLRQHCNLSFSLAIITDSETGADQFYEAITDDEVILLAKIMLLCYYKRKITKLRPMSNMFAAAELKTLYSPASERDSYIKMAQSIELDVIDKLALYDSKDRLTNAHKTITYALPSETESED